VQDPESVDSAWSGTAAGPRAWVPVTTDGQGGARGTSDTRVIISAYRFKKLVMITVYLALYARRAWVIFDHPYTPNWRGWLPLPTAMLTDALSEASRPERVFRSRGSASAARTNSWPSGMVGEQKYAGRARQALPGTEVLAATYASAGKCTPPSRGGSIRSGSYRVETVWRPCGNRVEFTLTARQYSAELILGSGLGRFGLRPVPFAGWRGTFAPAQESTSGPSWTVRGKEGLTCES
jgi:hypothetical protein